jgi:GNAT superfamily N-acetyltransferase
MLHLKAVPFLTVQRFFVDFQKKSKSFEMPEDSAQIIGIFKDKELIGYYIIQGYDGTDVEIKQGYLIPEYRHNDLPKSCMKLLEEGCKKAGYKKVLLATGSRFRAYFKFAAGLGYKPVHLEFSKDI